MADPNETVSPDTSAPSAPSQPASGRVSMKDAIRSAVQDMSNSAGKSAAPASAPDKPDDTAAPEPSSPAEDSGGPQKAKPDAAKPKGAEQPAAKAAGEPKSAPPSEGKPGSQAPAKAASLEAPARWLPQERADFSRLPDDAKRILLAREQRFNSAYTQATQQLAETRQRLEGLTSVFTPTYRQQMQQAGLDERGAIEYLTRFHDLYEADPVRYVRAAIEAKGLTPSQVFPQLAASHQPSTTPAQQSEDEWIDPAVLKQTHSLRDHFNQELATVRQSLAQLTQSQQQALAEQQRRADTERQAMQQSLEDVVTAFATATGEGGELRYPHFEDVFDQMLYLMQTNPALKQIPLTNVNARLEQAYEMAVRLNPDLYQASIDAAAENRLAAYRQEQEANAAAQAAERAKRVATVQPSPGANAGAVRPGRMSLRDSVKTAVSEHYV